MTGSFRVSRAACQASSNLLPSPWKLQRARWWLRVEPTCPTWLTTRAHLPQPTSPRDLAGASHTSGRFGGCLGQKVAWEQGISGSTDNARLFPKICAFWEVHSGLEAECMDRSLSPRGCLASIHPSREKQELLHVRFSCSCCRGGTPGTNCHSHLWFIHLHNQPEFLEKAKKLKWVHEDIMTNHERENRGKSTQKSCG